MSGRGTRALHTKGASMGHALCTRPCRDSAHSVCQDISRLTSALPSTMPVSGLENQSLNWAWLANT